jgi:hypothetical protein
MIIHQLMHGYRRGHERIAGSLKLDAQDAAVVDRLSDLSGVTSSGSDFRPYLTGYPVPSGRFWAIAKTWPDPSASRPGCVNTHTLLIRSEDWTRLEYPEALHMLFREPSNGRSGALYQSEIRFEDSAAMPSGIAMLPQTWHNATYQSVRSFVGKYFDEGVRPIVWFDHPSPDSFIWLLIRYLWPRLRESFAFCTLSLDLRGLVDRPFDILFAPAEAKPKFRKLTSRHFVTPAGTPPPAGSNSRDSEETWLQSVAEQILTGEAATTHGPDELRFLWHELDAAPAALGRVYRLQALRSRLQNTPTSAVGMLDLISAFVSGHDAAVQFKISALEEAVSSVLRFPDVRARLTGLHLISERLGRPAYKLVSGTFSDRIEAAVRTETHQEPEIAMDVAEEFLSVDTPVHGSTFVRGFVDGIRKLARSDSRELLHLGNFDHVGPAIISSDPSFAMAYMEVARRLSRLNQAAHDVVQWAQKVPASENRAQLRSFLFQAAAGNDALLRELLRTIVKNDATQDLHALWTATRGFESKGVRDLTAGEVTRLGVDTVLGWATTLKERWTFGVAVVVARCFSGDLTGLSRLLVIQRPDGDKSLALAAFLIEVSTTETSQWLTDSISNNRRIFDLLLADTVVSHSEASQAVGIALNALPSESLASAISVRHLDVLVQAEHGAAFVDRFFSRLLAADLSGSVPDDVWAPWVTSRAYETWLKQHAAKLVGLVRSAVRDSSARSVKAWRLLADAPDYLYSQQSSVVVNVVEAMTAKASANWSDTVTELWITTLNRLEQTDAEADFLKLASITLSFAFRHTSLPVSPLVVRSFYPVYKAVTQPTWKTYVTDFLFDAFEWDKGKELRKTIVRSYMRSDWPRQDLAFSVVDRDLFKKIIKRTEREYHGTEFLTAMRNELRHSTDPRAPRMLQLLLQAMNSQEDEWI